MKYLWILVILAVVLSPILGLRSSPRQKQIENVRRLARQQGIHVQLARRPDARDDERDLNSACYRLPWGGKQPDSIRDWVLTHNSNRGMEAEWEGWRWFEGPAPTRLEPTLENVIDALPEDVTGLRADKAGVALYWEERGDEQEVVSIVESLKALRDAILALR